MTLLNHFPTDVYAEPRPNQIRALNAIEAAINNKKRFIVLEAPVGVGKSGVAAAIARWSKDTLISVPTKALQEQYLADFKDIRLMKGRSGYPCTFDQPVLNSKIENEIQSGLSVRQPLKDKSCSKGPCIGKRNGTRKKILAECKESGDCPYDMAIAEAQKHPAVCFNNWSFVFQTYHAGYFAKRKVLILDECHDLASFLRGMLSVSFTIRNVCDSAQLKKLTTLQDWLKFLKDDEQLLTIKTDNRESYLGRIERIEKASENVYGEKPIVDYHIDQYSTKIEFIPQYIGGMAHKLLFDFADIVIMMSGTIYDQVSFCAPLGIPANDATFIQLASDFPAKNRPVVLPRSNIDLSHKNWSKNLDAAVGQIQHIAKHHNDEKGIIHVSSYRMAQELKSYLPLRFVTHDKENFIETLETFFESEDNRILVSPIISQGVDFKDDRARWQIIVRPTYLTPQDKYVKFMLESGRWDWYRYCSLVSLGQQLGRPVRSNTDTGVTYLLDIRFRRLLESVGRLVPGWVRESFVN